ncbi:non-specific serine/threonine protein kinase [Anaeramoeba ignava]|uniref:non-specific serine/threonine protein kinase n=1 Tax=Anaeramoeba ignava TaxID=1746090 RepID=A0A9Q0REV2_ANAIG|nr:non-specific serine/threonine protein kinase [Anaeramoeba ignava]
MGSICSKKGKEITLEDFEVIQVISKGKNSKISIVKEKESKQIYVLKAFNKSQIIEKGLVANVTKERNLLIRLKSAFAVNAHCCFQNEDNLFFVMDFISGFDLFSQMQIFQEFEENVLKFYIAELLVALEDIHKLGSIHGDLKPENIMIDSNGHLCLIDFGSTKLIENNLDSNSEVQLVCGTIGYIAPELLLLRNPSYSSDFYSLGAILYEFLHGLPPFYSEDKSLMAQQIIRESPLFSSQISKECESLLKGLLEKDPNKRLGNKGSQEIRDHIFFKDINWEQIEKKQFNPFFVPTTQFIDLKFEKNILEELELSSIITDKEQKQFQKFNFNTVLENGIIRRIDLI